MYGFLTNQQLWGCMSFLDHISDYVYVHPMQYLSLAETLISKLEWEKSMAQSGHMVKNYQANNGRFAYNGFIVAINKKYQKITLCGFVSHHQSGIVENKNNFLMQGARTLLLRGMRMWPQIIDEIFWPF